MGEPMKTILLMRHAKSSWDDKVEDDRDRPISKRGKKNAQNIAEFLKDKELIPDLILASSAVRTRQTAEVVIEEMKYRNDICYLNKLYMGEVEIYTRQIQNLADDIHMVLVIGHNPSLDSLLQMITGKVESLPTAAVAYLTVPIDSWRDFSLEVQAELVDLWRPKDL
jgi:phosphohistidine phosphatase